jgi:carbonic anhydrase/acetyltransferase-like protein (isoleucine patch superfamily)
MSELPELAKPTIHPSVFVADTARIFGDVTIEADASVWFGASIRAEAAPVVIGAGTNIQDNVVIHTDDGFPVILGTDVTVGHSAVVHGATVAAGALIGMAAVLLNGATVEAGAFVAAGCIVPPGATVPERMLAVGSPMKIVREVRPEEDESTTNGLVHYKQYARIYKAMAEGDDK